MGSPSKAETMPSLGEDDAADVFRRTLTRGPSTVSVDSTASASVAEGDARDDEQVP